MTELLFHLRPGRPILIITQEWIPYDWIPLIAIRILISNVDEDPTWLARIFIKMVIKVDNK